MSDPHRPRARRPREENDAPDGVLADLRRLPEGQRFENVQEVARTLGLGTEQQRF